MERRNWTREELILAFNLYLKLNFGQMHNGNPDVMHLANLIQRTPGSIAMRLGNFASVDPYHQKRGVTGLPGGKKQVQPIWNEFVNNKEELFFESEKLRAKFEKKSLSELIDLSDIDIKEGKEKERLVKTRVNQSLFRSMVLASYNSTCCITGIKNSDLLVASHIVPWAEDLENRLNPRNGLCLNALHDRAFDKYLITISSDFKVKLSKRLKWELQNKMVKESFLQFEEQGIKMPQKYLPDEKLLERHNKEFAKRNR